LPDVSAAGKNRSAYAEVRPVLISTSSISILSSIVAISVASKSRPIQLPLSPLLPPPSLRAANTTQRATTGRKRQSRRTAAGSNGVLRVAEVGQGWEGAVQDAAPVVGWEGLEARVRWSAQKRWLATNPGCISISAKWRTASVSQCRAIRTLASVITVQALRVRRSESSALRLSSTGAGGQQV
jgi:hypothetical protein